MIEFFENHRSPVEPESNTDVSSIGPTWPPQETSFDRIKGFEVRQVVTNLGQVDEYRQLLEQARARTLIPESEATRFSFRFLARTELVPAIAELLDGGLELAIPLQGSGDFDDYSMVYIGYNQPGRESSPNDLQTSYDNVRTALQRSPRTYDEILQRAADQGYTVEALDLSARTEPDVRNQIAALYERFGWTPENVDQMLQTPTNIFVVARSNGQVVSAGIAEVAEINIRTPRGESVFRMAEMTEAATLEEHKGRGIYTAVAAMELRELAHLPEDQQVHIALGESNGLALGVLKAARDLGRTFAIESNADLGDRVLGYLPQHVPIDGTPRETTHNDLFPAYISRAEIQQFAGSRELR